jgi:hypothetical protein
MDTGCTACVVLLTPTEIYCSNAGDSRGVLSKDKQAVPLSYDHKPGNQIEVARIITSLRMTELMETSLLVELSVISNLKTKQISRLKTKLSQATQTCFNSRDRRKMSSSSWLAMEFGTALTTKSALRE